MLNIKQALKRFYLLALILAAPTALLSYKTPEELAFQERASFFKQHTTLILLADNMHEKVLRVRCPAQLDHNLGVCFDFLGDRLRCKIFYVEPGVQPYECHSFDLHWFARNSNGKRCVLSQHPQGPTYQSYKMEPGVWQFRIEKCLRDSIALRQQGIFCSCFRCKLPVAKRTHDAQDGNQTKRQRLLTPSPDIDAGESGTNAW